MKTLLLKKWRLGLYWMLFGASVLPLHAQDHHLKHHINDSSYLAQMDVLQATTDNPPASLIGSWETVIPDDNGAAIHRILGMQTVHTVMLPSGKLLLASGSSWRNPDSVQTYPEVADPATGMGLFIKDQDPFRNENLNTYYQLVNHTAIYDPEENTFFRIPSPLPVPDPDSEGRFAPNDMFCTGHLQLPNGNPLFVGGTQYYFPYRTGARTSYIFDWRTELKVDWKRVDWQVLPKTNDPAYLWEFSGMMKRGRWYPHLVPLLDGRFAIFSGFVGFEKGYPPMYRFEINHFVEFFDPAAYEARGSEAAWQAINVKDLEYSPFNTKLADPFEPTPCVDLEFFEYYGLDVEDPDFVAPCDCPERCVEDLQKDAFRLYPNNYMLAKNKIYLSREGEWVSLRTPDTEYMRRTQFTYWMEIGGTRNRPSVRFSPGPMRPDTITSYGTSFHDPNTNQITILGGQPISAGTLYPLNAAEPTHFAGGRGSRKIETFTEDPRLPDGGQWTEIDDFLGTQPQDDRTMHNAIILPTKQVLIVNGGNYDFYGAVHWPLLLTPMYNALGEFTEYERRRVAEAVEPRLYHNSAMLLPDGRVWVSGGNSARASVDADVLVNAPSPSRPDGQPKANLEAAEVDLYFFRDGQMGRGEKGMLTVPTENWTAEIYSPPYLFIDGDRRTHIQELKVVQGGRRGIEYRSTLGGKDFYLLHSEVTYSATLRDLPRGSISQKAALRLIKLPSFTHGWDSGQRMIEVPFEPSGENTLEFTLPNVEENLIVPGYYMLFYIDGHGKPSPAQMVRIDDTAKAP